MEILSTTNWDEKLLLTDTFNFSCHKGLSCFNSCCRNKYLPLSPYDVLRMKNDLEIHSDEFLSRYALYRIDELSGFPVISLKMQEIEGRPCPFVSEDGCIIYENRPSPCRLYPLARASKMEGDCKSETFFFKLKTSGCQGIKEKTEWKIQQWLEHQGLLPYLQWADRMQGVVFHPKRPPNTQLSQGQIQKIIVSCYNLDVFRDFIFNTSFLRKVEIHGDLVKRAKHEDEALLEISMLYLKNFLF